MLGSSDYKSLFDLGVPKEYEDTNCVSFCTAMLPIPFVLAIQCDTRHGTCTLQPLSNCQDIREGILFELFLNLAATIPLKFTYDYLAIYIHGRIEGCYHRVVPCQIITITWGFQPNHLRFA